MPKLLDLSDCLDALEKGFVLSDDGFDEHCISAMLPFDKPGHLIMCGNPGSFAEFLPLLMKEPDILCAENVKFEWAGTTMTILYHKSNVEFIEFLKTQP